MGLLAAFGLSFLFFADAAIQERRSADMQVVLQVGEHPLEELVKFASSALGRNFVISPDSRANLSFRIQITAQREFSSAKEYERFFEKILRAQSFALLPMDGLSGSNFELVDLRSHPQNKSRLAAGAVFVPSNELSQYDGRSILMTTSFETKHISAQVAQASLRQYITDQQLEKVFNVGDNSIVATAFPQTLVQIGQMIRMADLPPAEDPQAAERRISFSKRVADLEAKVAQLEARLNALEKK